MKIKFKLFLFLLHYASLPWCFTKPQSLCWHLLSIWAEQLMRERQFSDFLKRSGGGFRPSCSWCFNSRHQRRRHLRNNIHFRLRSTAGPHLRWSRGRPCLDFGLHPKLFCASVGHLDSDCKSCSDTRSDSSGVKWHYSCFETIPDLRWVLEGMV